LTRGVEGRRRIERAAEALEDAFHDVVHVVPVRLLDVQVHAAVRAERVEEILDQRRVEVPDPVARQLDPVHQVGPIREVEVDGDARVGHRNPGRAEAAQTRAVADRLAQRLAQDNADVLDRVVLVDLEVALGAHAQVEQSVARERVQQVVEEGDACPTWASPDPSSRSSTEMSVPRVRRSTVAAVHGLL
jgi:hypothetical protein